jgi:hypothetical protein
MAGRAESTECLFKIRSTVCQEANPPLSVRMNLLLKGEAFAWTAKLLASLLKATKYALKAKLEASRSRFTLAYYGGPC